MVVQSKQVCRLEILSYSFRLKLSLATSHALGRHFSTMFDITVENPNQKAEKLHV